MNFATPPGYRNLVILDRKKHKGLGVIRRHRHAFALPLTGIHLLAAEFVQVARHYPIVFARDTGTGSFLPLAVTGLLQNENLFVGDDGEWEKNIYVPAFVRRWPFYGARMSDEKQRNKLLICVDESGLERSDAPLFDASGEPAEIFAPSQALVQEMENARPMTEELCRSLNDLGLLEPFEAHAFPKQGQEMHLGGMFRVNETRLNALPLQDIQRLMENGVLARIYAHLMSLDNFKFLMDRASARRQTSRLVS